MSNELLLLYCALVDIIFVFLAARAGRDWLFGTIGINLILVGAFGAKLVSVFGLVTNVGNIFYACVFLATHFLLERDENLSRQNLVWFGVFIIFLFGLMAQFALHLAGTPDSRSISDQLQAVFTSSAKVRSASLFAYIFAQYINITLYRKIQKSTGKKFLWLRVNGANIVSQLVDSSFFFTLAFVDLSGPLLIQSILAGWAIKTAVVALGTPFLYADAYLRKK